MNVILESYSIDSATPPVKIPGDAVSVLHGRSRRVRIGRAHKGGSCRKPVLIGIVVPHDRGSMNRFNPEEAWTHPAKGKYHIAINTPNKFLRMMIIPPGYINEGDYIGIRVVNLEDGFNLDIAAVFIQYMQ